MNHELTPDKTKNSPAQISKNKPSRLKFILLIAPILLVIGGFLIWKTQSSATSKPTYQTTIVERGSIVSTVAVSGQVATAGTIPVSSQASGVIKTIFVKNGDVVTAGQKLAEILPDQQSLQRQSQAWASYLSAKNSVDSANQTLFTLQSDLFTKWKTYMDLAQSSSYQNSDLSPREDQRNLPQFWSPKDDWLASEAKFKNQQGVIAQAQAGLSSSWASYQAVSPVIQAPVSGIVKDITLVSGMTVSTTLNSSGTAAVSQKFASIVTGNSAVAQFSLSEIDVNKVKEGNKATITLDAIPGMTFTGHVIGIDTSGVVSSGVTNYPITIQFDSPIDKILPNMSASANIITNTKDDILLVPSAAIQSQGTQAIVRVLKNGNVTQVPVETGLVSDSQTEITSGLSEGDSVVTGTATGTTNTTRTGTSVFGGFGGGAGALRPGGFGGR
jgi:membrane fusion protein, macrolide-specific efflux system